MNIDNEEKVNYDEENECVNEEAENDDTFDKKIIDKCNGEKMKMKEGIGIRG